MDRLIIENVRCFRGRHEVHLAPLTILVGENSTGKSTLLAATRIASDLGTEHDLDFNEKPFLLGGYDQIASSIGPRGKRAEVFAIGAVNEIQVARQVSPALVMAEFVSRVSQPALRAWRFEAVSCRLTAGYDADERMISIEAETPSTRGEIKPDSFGFFPRRISPRIAAVLLHLRIKDFPRADSELFIELMEEWMDQSGPRPYAFAPIRTSPQRTYDPIKEIVEPEGGHVPMVLAGLHSQSPDEWVSLRRALKILGKASGLFDEVEIRRLGNSPSDPFQLQVKIN